MRAVLFVLLCCVASGAHADKKTEFLDHLSNRLPSIICEGQPGYAKCLGISAHQCMDELHEKMKGCVQDSSLQAKLPDPFADIPQEDLEKYVIMYGQCGVRQQILDGGYGEDKLYPCGGIQ